MAASLVPTEGGNPIALDKPIMLIGRNQDCDISLQTSSKVSRRHCCIVQCGERYLVRDLGSMNGVRVNSHRIVEAELKAGDEVAVADVDFTFRTDEMLAKPVVRARQEGPETPPAEVEVIASSSSSDDRDLLPLPPIDDVVEVIPDDELDEGSNSPLADGDRRLSDSQSQAGFVRV